MFIVPRLLFKPAFQAVFASVFTSVFACQLNIRRRPREEPYSSYSALVNMNRAGSWATLAASAYEPGSLESHKRDTETERHS